MNESPMILRDKKNPCDALYEALVGSKPGESSPLEKVALLLAALVALFAFLQSCKDLSKYPGADLRTRIVSTRIMMEGGDPYFGALDVKAPERLNDVLRTSVDHGIAGYTPALLMVTVPMALPPYRVTRFATGIISWILLAGTIVVLSRVCPAGRPRLMFLVASLAGFAASQFWRLHVERGQYYICILAPLALVLYWLLNSPKRTWPAACLFGVAFVFRPTLIVLPILLWIAGQRRMAWQSAVIGVLLVAASIPLYGVNRWIDMAKSTRAYQEGLMFEEEIHSKWHMVEARSGFAEGYYYDENAGLKSYSMNLTIDHMLGSLVKRFSLSYAKFHWLTRISSVLALGVFAASAIQVRRFAKSGVGLRYQLAFMFLAFNLLDHLVPVYYSYGDILLLLPLALLLPDIIDLRTPVLFLAAVVGGIVIGQGFLLEYSVSVPAYARFFALCGGMLVFTCWRARQPEHAFDARNGTT